MNDAAATEPVTEAEVDALRGDLIELIRRAAGVALDERLEISRTLLLEAGEAEDDLRPFYLVHQSDATMRVFGVQGARHHAGFLAQFGFEAQGPFIVVDLENPTLHEGVLDLDGPVEVTTTSESTSSDMVE